MQTKPFNLAEYEAADPKPRVFDSTGLPLRIICTNGVSSYPIVALVLLDGKEWPRTYTEDGCFSVGGIKSLVMEVPYEPTDEEVFAYFAEVNPHTAACSTVEGYVRNSPGSVRAIRKALKRIRELEQAVLK